MKRILMSVTLLLGALLFMAPLSWGQKLTLTVEGEDKLEGTKVTKSPSDLTQLDANAVVTFTFSDVPSGKQVVIKAKMGDENKVMIAGNAVTVKESATVVLSLEAKPLSPENFALTVNAPDATVTVKAAGKTLVAADYATIAKDTELMFEVKAKTGKKIDKVEVTVGSAAAKMITLSKEGTFTQKMTDNITVTVKAKPAAVEDAVLAGVVVYPNPFVDQLFVANTAEVTKVLLVNAQGIVVRTVQPSGVNELVLATEDLPAGVYVVVLERAEARKSIRIVK